MIKCMFVRPNLYIASGWFLVFGLIYLTELFGATLPARDLLAILVLPGLFVSFAFNGGPHGCCSTAVSLVGFAVSWFVWTALSVVFVKILQNTFIRGRVKTKL